MIAAIPPKPHAVQEESVYWENFLTKEDIDTILALPQWHDLGEAQIGGGDHGVVNNEIRTTDLCWWVPCEKTTHIWEKIIATIAEVNNQFFHFDLTGCYEPAQLGLYKAKDKAHYDWHIDAGQKGSAPRKLSMCLLLSDTDDFKGGNLELKTVNDQPITVEQKQGRAFFFPSYTLHRVTPVTKGIRRSLVIWIGGPPFK
jgi:predicted 2-oxoglutarate/Fe(II)-dependent dioxygenase YbiX